MKPALSSYQNWWNQKTNDRLISLLNMHSKINNKRIANQSQEHVKESMHLNQVAFIPGMQGQFNIKPGKTRERMNRVRKDF